MYLKLRIAHTQRMAIFPLDGAFCATAFEYRYIYTDMCVFESCTGVGHLVFRSWTHS